MDVNTIINLLNQYTSKQLFDERTNDHQKRLDKLEKHDVDNLAAMVTILSQQLAKQNEDTGGLERELKETKEELSGIKKKLSDTATTDELTATGNLLKEYVDLIIKHDEQLSQLQAKTDNLRQKADTAGLSTYERPCFYHISQASASASNSNEAKRYLTVDETGKLYSVETDAKNAAQFAIVENSDSEGTKSIIFIDPRGVNSPPRYVAVTANKTLNVIDGEYNPFYPTHCPLKAKFQFFNISDDGEMGCYELKSALSGEFVMSNQHFQLIQSDEPNKPMDLAACLSQEKKTTNPLLKSQAKFVFKQVDQQEIGHWNIRKPMFLANAEPKMYDVYAFSSEDVTNAGMLHYGSNEWKKIEFGSILQNNKSIINEREKKEVEENTIEEMRFQEKQNLEKKQASCISETEVETRTSLFSPPLYNKKSMTVAYNRLLSDYVRGNEWAVPGFYAHNTSDFNKGMMYRITRMEDESGRMENEFKRRMNEFETQNENKWKLMELTATLQSRSNFALARIGHNVFITGGQMYGRVTNACQIINLTAGEGNTVKSFYGMNMARHNHCALTIGDTVYIFGGDSRGHGIWRNSRDLEEIPSCYNSRDWRIHFIKKNPIGSNESTDGICEWKLQGNLCNPRSGATGAVAGRAAYVIGGIDCNRVLTSVERFDPRMGKCVQVKAMQEHRLCAASAEYNGLIYVSGGFDPENIFDTAEIYDPRADGWMEGPKMNTGRCGHALVSDGNRLLSIGGYSNKGYSNTIEELVPGGDGKWVTLSAELLFGSTVRAIAF